jgi:NAD(P)-dependent dehydrogenase (short-subunit alcohol dehydrogenase family)
MLSIIVSSIRALSNASILYVHRKPYIYSPVSVPLKVSTHFDLYIYAMEPKTTVLITGSNRGIGLGLVERFLAKPSHVVIAAVRNPGHPTAQALYSLPTGPNTQLIVVKLDVSIDKDAHEAVVELQQKRGVAHLDIVIANAGVAYIYPTVADVKIEDIKAHMQPNVYGVITLYQATRALLKKAAREPIFMIMGSSAGLLK